MRRRRGYYTDYNRNSDYNVVNDLLTKAFKLFRRAGFVARKNYLCCQSCAGAALGTMVEAMPAEKRKKVKGVVYFHNQDAEFFRRSGTVYLAYGQIAISHNRVVGLPAIDVGNAIVEILKSVGLDYEWDGSDDTRILVKKKVEVPLDFDPVI